MGFDRSDWWDDPQLYARTLAQSTLAADNPCDTANAVWVGTAYGATCLDDAGWHSYPTGGTGISDPSGIVAQGSVDLSINDIALCADKVVRFANEGGVDQTNDGTVWKLLSHPHWNAVTGIACDPKGGFWATHFQGVSYYDGSQWTDYSASLMGTSDSVSLVKDVAVAPDGKVWVVTRSSVASLAHGMWTVYEKDKGFDEDHTFTKVAIDGKGNVWVAAYEGVLMFNGKTWVVHKNSEMKVPFNRGNYNALGGIQALAFDSKGDLWIGTGPFGVAMYTGKGWVNYRRATSKISSDNAGSLAGDSQGRIWVGTEFGLDVFDGKNWTAFHMDNSDLLDNAIETIAVSGTGPRLPAPLPQKTGSLKGRVTIGAQAAAGAVVELCSERIDDAFSGDSPCAGKPYTVMAVAGADGVFSFKNVPVGRYGITVHHPLNKKWVRLIGKPHHNNYILYNNDLLAEISEGSVSDMGDLDISHMPKH